MAVIKLSVDIPDKDRELIKSLGGLSEATLTAEKDAEKNKTNTQVYAVRARTIEQVKRLYAVVMGFALTTCFANAYLCFRKMEADVGATMMLGAVVFTFASLMVLFYLGAERMLEGKYLRLDSNPANAWELLGDLVTLWSTAGLFVVLANSFPLVPLSGLIVKESVYDFFELFLVLLAILYALDVATLLLQILLLKLDKGPHDRLILSHWTWCGINAASFLVVLGFYYYGATAYVGPKVAALLLVAGHAIRFAADYGLTFKSYYPQDKIV